MHSIDISLQSLSENWCSQLGNGLGCRIDFKPSMMIIWKFSSQIIYQYTYSENRNDNCKDCPQQHRWLFSGRQNYNSRQSCDNILLVNLINCLKKCDLNLINFLPINMKWRFVWKSIYFLQLPLENNSDKRCGWHSDILVLLLQSCSQKYIVQNSRIFCLFWQMTMDGMT